MKVSVQKGRKQIRVLNWGQAPFAVEQTKRGTAYIPHGFTAETFADKKIWIGRTRVLDASAEYQFSLKGDPARSTSDWCRTPSAAYQQANERMRNLRYRKGSNGAVILGCTYPETQKEIFSRLHDELLPYTEEGKRQKMSHDETMVISSSIQIPSSPSTMQNIENQLRSDDDNNLFDIDNLDDDAFGLAFELSGTAG